MHCNLILKPVWTSDIVAMARWSSHMNTILKYHKNNVHNLRPDSPTPANSPLLHIRSISWGIKVQACTWNYIRVCDISPPLHNFVCNNANTIKRETDFISILIYIHYGSCLKTPALSYWNCSNNIKTKQNKTKQNTSENCNISQMS
jgi:hypothetical protein